MRGLLEVFGVLEAVLLAVSLLVFIWGRVRTWELEMLYPLAMAFYGTIVLVALLLISIVLHDHVRIGFR